MLIGNTLNIDDFEGVSYRDNIDVVNSFPEQVNGNFSWNNSSTNNIMVNSDGYLMADQNDEAEWTSNSIRINDNRKIVYEADVASPGEIGVTVKVSDYENFTEVKDIQKESLRNGFDEIDLDMDRGRYTRILIEFDKNADSSDAVNSLSLQGVRSDVRADFSRVLSEALVLILFLFLISFMATRFEWW